MSNHLGVPSVCEVPVCPDKALYWVVVLGQAVRVCAAHRAEVGP